LPNRTVIQYQNLFLTLRELYLKSNEIKHQIQSQVNLMLNDKIKNKKKVKG